MTDIRKHRGAHPKDRKLFAAAQLPALRTAIADLSWLLTRGYAIKAALKLVGDRHTLADRQRIAISRAACSDQSQERRTATSVRARAIAGEELIIDGFNLIITIEAALSGGLLMLCRDGCIRDLSSVYGSYRSVIETGEAIRLIGNALQILRPKSAAWVLDRPISNSGRLAKRIRDLANERGWPWSIETAFNPDREIASSGKIVVSSDGPLLDRAKRWVNFNRYLVESRKGQPWLIDLS
jgi:hypothetical protein